MSSVFTHMPSRSRVPMRREYWEHGKREPAKRMVKLFKNCMRIALSVIVILMGFRVVASFSRTPIAGVATHHRAVARVAEPVQQLTPLYALIAWTQALASGTKLDAAERQRVIDAVIKNLKQYYFDSHIAQEIENALLTHEKQGEYDAVVEDDAFAALLTRHIRYVSHDMHLEVVYSTEQLPDRPQEPTPEALARYRRTLERENCTFEAVKVLPQNIGYLKLNAFPDPSICEATARATMASLNGVVAIIFDLRDNGGGSGAMVSLIAAYLFNHPEFLYDPRVNPTLQSWTQPVPGNRLMDKPVYVLTSGSTVSAAEQFCYDLKMLKRVTLVGETTRGSAHAGVWYRIDDHFGMGIPRIRAINPFSKADWEGTGVEPDVKVKATNALQTAEKLAENRLRKRPSGAHSYRKDSIGSMFVARRAGM